MLVRRIKHEGVHAVVSEVTVRSRRVVVLEPGTIPKTPSGKLRRATSHALWG
jgi:fatty-acyl-CoA synthase